MTAIATKTAASVKPRKVSWLWKPRIALGKVTIVAGDGGLGKSAMMLDLTARLSKGDPWPNTKQHQKPAEVLYCSGEDDDDDTLVPRLIVAKANRDRVHLIDELADGADDFYIDSDEDEHPLADFLQKHPDVRLVVIDPLSAFVAKTDLTKTVECRKLLRKLRVMAKVAKVAIVLIEHINKPSKSIMEAGRATNRVGGNKALTNAARSVLMLELDPHEEERRLLVSAKQNLARRPEGIAFYMHDTPDEIPEVVWDREEVAWTADKLLTKKEQARDLIREATAEGPVDSAELGKLAKALGISERTLYRARDEMGVTVEQIRGNGRIAGWMVSLTHPTVSVDSVGRVASQGAKADKAAGGIHAEDSA